MRGKLILLLCLFMLGLPTLAEPLKATVTYTEENARIEAFEGVKPLSIKYAVGWDDPKYYFDLNAKNDNILCIQELNAKLFKIIPFKCISVMYKDEPNKVYTYEKTNNRYKLVTIDTIESLDNGTIRTLKYSQDGHLLSVGLSISEDEDFVFDENKKIIGHWIDEKEHINKTSTRKIIYSAP